MNIYQDKILILDFGSQYTQLIARRIRELNVYCEIIAWDAPFEFIRSFEPKGIILSGGGDSTCTDLAPKIPVGLLEIGCPILGICYGMQALARHFDGRVEKSSHHEYGKASIQIIKPNALLDDISDRQEKLAELDVWMSHGDHITQVPEGFQVIASSASSIAAIAHEEKGIYGLQFHPEVTHTKQGTKILARFLDLCSCAKNWQPAEIIEDLVKKIQTQVQDKNVVLGLSGGVDSSVVALLLNKAIDKQLHSIFINTGLLRLEEEQEVCNLYQQLGLPITYVNAQESFFLALQGVKCPEEKRKVIGKTFVEIFEHHAQSIPNTAFLAQGTIYPDIIESAGAKTGKAKVIKSHHNVAGLPEKMALQLIEPLRELFKDEVRNLGLQLGLPKSMVFRHPFPGPGLAVRILGEIKVEFVAILQRADKIFLEVLEQHGYYHKVAQAFAVFLPVRSVGITGDNRRYEYVIALRAVETTDFMTAHCAQLPYELLESASSRIINEIPQVSRVTYDISSKPPATIEWE